MPINIRDLYKVKMKHWDPRDPVSELHYHSPRGCLRFDVAEVTDNQDPMFQGRIKVWLKKLGDNAITDWIYLARPYSSFGAGLYALPGVGTTVVCAFLLDNPMRPVALGCIYGQPTKIVPPQGRNPENHIKKLTSKSGMEIVLDDKSGEEKVVLQTKEGKMILILDKAKGFTVENNLGDVEIECDTLVMESGKDAVIQAQKDFIVAAGDVVQVKSGKAVTVKSAANVVVKGQSIKLKGSGVTAKGKQIAAKGDLIVGVDKHDVKFPSSSGYVVVPMLPHPFLGDLKDKLSKDVKVNNKAVATKGSKGKTKIHIPLGPLGFNKQPSKIGEVTNMCEASVKVNGKDVAVLGSMVKSCNDPADFEGCKIVAFGIAISFPATMLGMDGSKYNGMAGDVPINTRDPYTDGANAYNGPRSLTNPLWGTVKANIGEEVTLSVDIQSHENASVVFNIWEEGADRENDQPVKRINASAADGKAEGKWRYYYEGREPLAEKPKFHFTADSFLCDQAETSGTVEFGMKMEIKCVDRSGKLLKGISYNLEKSSERGTTMDDGLIKKDSVIPGERIVFSD